jgi:hypothetical protein
MTNNYGVALQGLIDFENIYIERLNLEVKIKWKIYCKHRRYKNGKLKNTSILFDGSEKVIILKLIQQRILKILFKMTDGKYKTI